MDESTQGRDPATLSEWLMAGGLLAVMLGLFAAEVYSDYTPIKWSVLLVVMFWIPLLALHEAGHALAAFLLGWHVSQVVIGMGKPLGRFQIGSAKIEIRLIPIEGFVRCVPTKLRLPRMESALIYLAGPGGELLLPLALLLFVGREQMLTRTDDYAIIVWQSLALAAASQGVLNLIPFAVRTPDGNMASDGLGIIFSFFRPLSYYAAMIGAADHEPNDDWEPQDSADWWKREK